MTRRFVVLHKHRGESKLVTDLTTDKCFFFTPVYREISFHQKVQTGPAFHTAASGFISQGYRPVYKADRSPPYSVEVKNAWRYTNLSPIHLLKLYRENFNFNRTEGLTKL